MVKLQCELFNAGSFHTNLYKFFHNLCIKKILLHYEVFDEWCHWSCLWKTSFVTRITFFDDLCWYDFPNDMFDQFFHHKCDICLPWKPWLWQLGLKIEISGTLQDRNEIPLLRTWWARPCRVGQVKFSRNCSTAHRFRDILLQSLIEIQKKVLKALCSRQFQNVMIESQERNEILNFRFCVAVGMSKVAFWSSFLNVGSESL